MLRPARYLIAVADHGSFTRAAAELHVSQPAMSQQVKQLEESLGVQLLDRNGAKLKPTDAGRIYIEHLRRALQSIEAAGRAVHDVENLAEGTLRIAFLPLFTPYPAPHLGATCWPLAGTGSSHSVHHTMSGCAARCCPSDGAAMRMSV